MTRPTLSLNLSEEAMLGRIRVHAPKPRKRCQRRASIIDDFRAYARENTATEVHAPAGQLTSIALANDPGRAKAKAEGLFFRPQLTAQAEGVGT